MVAGIYIAIMLHNGCMTAFLGIDADSWLNAHPACKGGIKELYKDFAHIFPHPFVEDGTHEMPPFFGSDAEGCNRTVLVEELSQMPSIAVLLDALHNRTYLQELAIQFIAKEMIEGQRVLGIIMIGSSHRIPFYAVFIEELDAVHHFLPSALSLNIKAIGIVLLLSAVDTDAHEPAFIVQELAPFWGKQSAVGLNAVADALAPSIVLLKPDSLFVEAQRPEHRFATMPSEKHIGHLLNLNIIANVLLKERRVHSPLF